MKESLRKKEIRKGGDLLSSKEQVISMNEMENKIIKLFEENGYSLSDARMVLQCTSMNLQYHSEVKLKNHTN